MPHCVDYVKGIEKEIPECFFNVSECFWQPVVIIIIDRDRDSDIDIDRQLMAPFGLPQFPLSLSLSLSVTLSLSPCPLWRGNHEFVCRQQSQPYKWPLEFL